MPITHNYVSAAPPVSGKVDSTAWNEDHIIALEASDIPALPYGDVFDSGIVVGQLVQGVTDSNHITAAAIIPPVTNILTLTNAAAATLALNITAGKTLTLTAVDNYTLTIPATGTAALLGTANVFTAVQQINGALACAPTTNAFGTSSIYTSFIVGRLSGVDGANGGLYAIGRYNKTNEPFTALSGEDNGTTRILYFGGGGWNVPDATNLKFYAAPAYNETNNAGILCMDISSGNVTIPINLAATTTVTIGSASLAALALSITSATNLTGFRHTDGTRVVGDYLDSTGTWLGSISNHALHFMTNFGTSRMSIGAAGGVTILPISDVNQLKVTGFTTQTLPVGYIIDNTAATNTVRNVLQLETQSTGTAAALGVGLLLSVETATNGVITPAGRLTSQRIVNTNGSETSTTKLSAYKNSVEQVGIEVQAGTTVMLGLFGGTAAVQQVLNAYTSDGEGAAYTGIDNLQIGTVYATVADLNQLRVAYEALRASYDDLRTKLITSTLVA